jgi:hypothetical protein
MNPILALSLLSFVTGMLITFSPHGLAAVSPQGDHSPQLCIARILPSQMDSDRSRVSQIECLACRMIRLLSKLRHAVAAIRHDR